MIHEDLAERLNSALEDAEVGMSRVRVAERELVKARDGLVALLASVTKRLLDLAREPVSNTSESVRVLIRVRQFMRYLQTSRHLDPIPDETLAALLADVRELAVDSADAGSSSYHAVRRPVFDFAGDGIHADDLVQIFERLASGHLFTVGEWPSEDDDPELEAES